MILFNSKTANSHLSRDDNIEGNVNKRYFKET